VPRDTQELLGLISQLWPCFLWYSSCRAKRRLQVSFGKACVSILQSVPGNPSNDIMEALKNGSLYSDILKENWRHQLEKYRIVSFYEGIGNVCIMFPLVISPNFLQLVPRESAIFGLPGDRENVVKLDAKHENMCRFDPLNQTDKKNYFYVEGNISELVAAAIKESKSVASSLESLPHIRVSGADTISDHHLQRRFDAL